MSSVVYQRQPPCDPKTLGVRQDQRREIGAWIRSREVKCVLPQRASVPELDCIGKPLFLVSDCVEMYQNRQGENVAFSGIKFAAGLAEETHNPLLSHEI